MEYKRYSTINELLDESFAKYPLLPAYTCMGHTLTYREVDELSRQFTSYIQNHTQLKPGDRIAIQLPNILQFPVVLYGAIRAGLVVVNTNPLYTPRELQHQLSDSGAKALVVLTNVAHNAASIIAKTDVETVITTELGDLLPWLKKTVVNFAVKHIKKMVPDFHFSRSVTFTDVMALGGKPVELVYNVTGSVAVLQYTGGTTGLAKGAMLSHGNLCTNVDQLDDHLTKLFVAESEVIVAALPLYHIFAFNIHGLYALSRGGHNILIPNPRDVNAFVDAVKNLKVVTYVAVNTLYNALTRNEAFRRLDFSHLVTSAAGGMALTADVAQAWEQLTGCAVCEGYGLTETSPVVASNPDTDIRLGTIGTALKDTELKVIDKEGALVVDGEAGELCVRGPQVMLGYWQSPKATAEVLSEDSWFKTGDMALHCGDGYFKLVDRKKDMILVSGFNVYPNEVEGFVCSHPAVVEAAVVGVPNEETGEAVKLFVVVSDTSLTEELLIRFCREGLTGYKIPKSVEFRDQLPKSNVGKILRRELRSQ